MRGYVRRADLEKLRQIDIDNELMALGDIGLRPCRRLLGRTAGPEAIAVLAERRVPDAVMPSVIRLSGGRQVEHRMPGSRSSGADGSNTPLSSRFARWRVRPSRDDAKRSEPAPEEWLLIEWPEGADEPDHYWLSTLPAEI